MKKSDKTLVAAFNQIKDVVKKEENLVFGTDDYKVGEVTYSVQDGGSTGIIITEDLKIVKDYFDDIHFIKGSAGDLFHLVLTIEFEGSKPKLKI